MRIVCLVNGTDGLIAYHHTKEKYPDAEIFAVHFDLGLPFSKKIQEALPDYVRIEALTHYKNIIDVEVHDGVYKSDRPYSPMIWMAVMKYRADKVILGVLATDPEIEHNSETWVDAFNSKTVDGLIEYPLKDLGMSKQGALEYILKNRKAAHVADLFTCRSEDFAAYGCGNCNSCLRKRSALINLGRGCRIPSPTRVGEFATTILFNYSHELLNGMMPEYLETEFIELQPALSELLGTDDPQKMAKLCNKYAKKRR